jgi:hypothetical protein
MCQIFAKIGIQRRRKYWWRAQDFSFWFIWIYIQQWMYCDSELTGRNQGIAKFLVYQLQRNLKESQINPVHADENDHWIFILFPRIKFLSFLWIWTQFFIIGKRMKTGPRIASKTRTKNDVLYVIEIATYHWVVSLSTRPESTDDLILHWGVYRFRQSAD